ncbi:beta strand repeat-containing protein [Flavobacterium aestivum]|uniref:beta strand repeat-containing protein n=1 Tax=Flavobacterium aestivum TaxID=3003257 RepID=UPI0024827972|nr:hypothetical protein [Flavobacterium aestivum]
MATSRINISNKFENGDIPSQNDFGEIFDSFVHKDEDKANFQMVEAGIDNQHYVTPALLNTGLRNIGIITGNCYMPFKEHIDNFSGTTLSLEKLPIQYSVKVYKNGQLLLEGEDYTINYDTAVITFSSNVSNRNIEVDYWYKNLSPNPGNGSGTAIDLTNFLHTTGNETKSGILTFNNTTPTSTNGIVLTNSGATATALDVTNSSAGNGIAMSNSSTGTAVKLSNTGDGVAINLNSATASTGDLLQVAKNNVVKTKIDSEGNVTAPKFTTTGGTNTQFIKGDGTLDPTVYANNNFVIHTTGNESKDGALNLTHDTSQQDVLTITKNNSANCLKLVQNSSSNATTSTFDTTTANVNRKAISVQKIQQENAFITHDGNVTGTSFTTLNEKADITDGFLTLAGSASPAASQGHAKLYAKTDGTTDMYVMGSDGVEKKIGGVVDLSGKENTIAPGSTAQYYRGDKTWQTLDKTAVGLANIDNTSDLNKPVSMATQVALNNVLHKTGFSTETKTGELVIDSGTTGISGLKLTRITQPRSTYATIPSSNYGLINIGNVFYTTNATLVKIENTVSSSIGPNRGSTYSLCYNNNDNKIYIGGNLSRIHSVNPDGTGSVIVATFTANDQYFYGITVASDNNIYVLDYTSGNIHRSTPAGVKTENFANVGAYYNTGLISGNNGFIYAAHDNSIKKINIANGVVTNLVTTTKSIYSLFLHSDGYIYMNNLDSVAKVLLDGTNLTENWVSGLSSPNRAEYGICSQGGELYIKDNNTISKLIQSQKTLKTDSSGLVVSSTYLEDVPYLKASDVDLSTYAKLASPTFTGVPTAPTATAGTNTDQIATTAFVIANTSSSIPHLESNNTNKTVWNNGQGNIATNTSFGENALKSNTTGYGNTALGNDSLPDNTSGSANTAIGASSLRLNISGNENTAVGFYSLLNCKGSKNTAIGKNAGSYLSTGDNNIFIGRETGSGITTGSGNVIIGYTATSPATLTNNIIIANGAGTIAAQHDGTNWTFRGQINKTGFDVAPLTSTSAGNPGEIRITDDYIYVCKQTNLWVRTALTSW